MYPATESMHEGRILPSISFSQFDLPEVTEWEINQEYFLVLRVEMTGKHNTELVQSENSADNTRTVGEFRVKSIRALDDTPIDVASMRREEDERVLAKAKAGEL